MFQLLAETNADFFPDHFLGNIVTTLIYTGIIVIILFPVFWKVMHWITPGKLDEEILGNNTEANFKAPNVALAIIVGALALGFCIIIAAAIH